MRDGLALIAACVFSVATPAQAQAPPPPPPPPPPVSFQAPAPVDPRTAGAISGVILDRTTGAPVSAATVQVSQRGSTQVFQTQRHVTDARGRFVARDLPPANTYTVSASKPGFFDTSYGPPGASYADAQPITVAEGQWVSNVEIRLTRQGVITGRVIDETGDPVVGVYVRTLAEIPIAGRPQLAVSEFTRTDDRGEYRIAGLRAGRYIVTVPSVQHALPTEMPPPNPNVGPRPELTAVAVDADTRISVGSFITPPPRDATPRAYPAVFYPGVRTIAEATPLEVEPGRTYTADFRMQPVTTFRVSGTVETSEGSSVGLVLRLVGTGLEDLAFGSEAATAVVDPQGRFSFVNVPAGRYTLEGRRSLMEYRYTSGVVNAMPVSVSPAFAAQSSGAGSITGAPPGAMFSYSTAANGGDLVGRTSIDVNGRDLTGVVLPMRRPVKLTGRLDREPDDETEQGAPPVLPQAFRGLVQAQPADGSASLGLQSGGILEDGKFEVSGLLQGPYVLRVLGVGTIRSISWAGKDVTNVPFDGSNGQDFTDVVVTLTRKTTSLTGTVRRPAAGNSTVIVFPVDRDGWTNFGFNPSRLMSVSAAANGSYQTQLPGGEYYAVAVDARHALAWQNPALLAKLAPLASRVTLEWGDKKTLDLTHVEVP